jgi:chromosome segregation ATPase
MRRLTASLFAASLFAAALPASLPLAHAEEKDSAEDRLRAALRSATQRVRELEDQNAQALAKQAATERDRAQLVDKLAADEKDLAALRQQTAQDKDQLTQTASRLQAQEQNTAKWQSSYQEAADAARSRDADAKRLDMLLARTRDRVQACETKNADLGKLADQVLDLYDRQDFFDRMASSEPVTKLKRVEIENALQDYHDKMRDDRVTPPGQ